MISARDLLAPPTDAFGHDMAIESFIRETKDIPLAQMHSGARRYLRQHCNARPFDFGRDGLTDTRDKFVTWIARVADYRDQLPYLREQIDHAVRSGQPEQAGGDSAHGGSSSVVDGDWSATVNGDSTAPSPHAQPVQTATPAPTGVIALDARIIAAAQRDSLARQVGDLMAALAAMQAPAIDEAAVRRIVDAAVENALRGHARAVRVEQPDLPPVNVGMQHRKFETLLRMCNARMRDGHRLNIWMHGPAGSGKTSAAKAVSEALGLKFAFNGALDQPYHLIGFVTGNGHVVRTPFRDAWERGGIYLFDEIDASSASALLCFNAALANGVFCFPDVDPAGALIPRHPDCVIIAGANTTGKGGTMEYSGRTKIDAATLDRFAMLEWPLDDALEDALCANNAWLQRVRRTRANVAQHGIKNYLVTPRASYIGEALLSAGLAEDCVADAVLRRGVSEDVWHKIR